MMFKDVFTKNEDFTHIDSNKKYCFVMAGVPGAGKSTLAKRLNSLLGNMCEYISMDAMRKHNSDGSIDQTNNDEIFSLCSKRIYNASKHEQSMIVDNQNRGKKERKHVASLLCDRTRDNYKLVYIYLYATCEQCLKNNMNKTRDHHTSDKYIARFTNQNLDIVDDFCDEAYVLSIDYENGNISVLKRFTKDENKYSLF